MAALRAAAYRTDERVHLACKQRFLLRKVQMPRPEATPEQKAEIRKNIHDAATAVYKREGSTGLSVRAIAKEAGVSVGTIYTYFGSQQELLESLWSWPVARLGDEMQKLAHETADPLERIRGLLGAYLAFARKYSEIYRGVFLYVRPLDQPYENREPARNVILPSLLEEAIVEGQKAGAIVDGKADDMAMMLWGSLHGCLALPNNFGRFDFEKPDAVSEGVIDLLVRALLV